MTATASSFVILQHLSFVAKYADFAMSFFVLQ